MKEVLKTAIVLIIIASLIGLAFGIFNMGKHSAEVSQGTIGETLNKYADKYSKYEVGTLVLGEEILDLLNEDMEIEIVVATGEDTAGTTYKKDNLSTTLVNATAPLNGKYINPYKNFKVTAVNRNSNGVITKLTFTQA